MSKNSLFKKLAIGILAFGLVISSAYQVMALTTPHLEDFTAEAVINSAIVFDNTTQLNFGTLNGIESGTATAIIATNGGASGTASLVANSGLSVGIFTIATTANAAIVTLTSDDAETAVVTCAASAGVGETVTLSNLKFGTAAGAELTAGALTLDASGDAGFVTGGTLTIDDKTAGNVTCLYNITATFN